MPWLSAASISCGVFWELIVAFLQFYKLQERTDLEQTYVMVTIFSMFTFLMEDLLQISILLHYNALEPKKPRSYDQIVEITSLTASVLGMLCKSVCFAWTNHERFSPDNEIQLKQCWMSFSCLLIWYSVPGVIIYVTTYVYPTAYMLWLSTGYASAAFIFSVIYIATASLACTPTME